MSSRSALGIVVLASFAVACGGATGESPEDWTATVQSIETPAAAGSLGPQLTASNGAPVLSWIERDGGRSTLRYAERTSGGWSAAQTVAAGDDWFVSWADVPAVMRLSDGTVVANWFVATREEIEAYDLLLSYSRDGGKTWADPFRPHRDGTETQHGFATLFEMPDRGLGLVWLDGRDMHENTTHPEGGVMMLRFTRFDPAWAQGDDVVINEQVCECCQTAAVVTPDGVLTAFRDRSDEEIRDIAVSRLESGAWTEPLRVHADNWEIYGCPVNGPALSAAGRDVAAAWFTMNEDVGYAYAAFSSDAGRTWGDPIRLNDQQSLGYVDIEMLDDGSAVASWAEYVDDRRHIRMRRVTASGESSPIVEVAGSGEGRVTGYPRMARQGDELLFAWTENLAGSEATPDGGYIRGAVARLPRTSAP